LSSIGQVAVEPEGVGIDTPGLFEDRVACAGVDSGLSFVGSSTIGNVDGGPISASAGSAGSWLLSSVAAGGGVTGFGAGSGGDNTPSWVGSEEAAGFLIASSGSSSSFNFLSYHR